MEGKGAHTMRRSGTVLLASCLVFGGPGITVAEAPPDELLGTGGHVRLPEHGFALSVPDDWIWARMAEPIPDELVELMAQWSESLVEHGVLLLTPAVPLDDSRPEICVVASFPNTSPSVTTQELVDAMTGPDLADRRGEGFIEASEPVVEWLDLPVGSTPRVDMTRRRPTEQTPAASSTYFFADALTVHSLICTDDALPDDHWRSIAESFELLVPPTPELDQRLEGNGFALRVPKSWKVTAATPAEGPQPLLEGADWEGVAYVAEGVAYAHDAEFSCRVIDATQYARARGLVDVDAAVAWEMQAFSGDSDSPGGLRILDRLTDAPTNVTSAFIELSAGRAGVVDVTDPGWWNSRTYVMSDGDRWFYLHCDDTFEPPPDDWLSIAESFEFLPAEE